MKIIKPHKECITCKGELADGTIAKAFGYCPTCHVKLTDGPEMHAADYLKQKKEKKPAYASLIEFE